MVQLLAITLVDGLKLNVHVLLLRIANGNRSGKRFQQEPALRCNLQFVLAFRR
jgi:hypothetical protein